VRQVGSIPDTAGIIPVLSTPILVLVSKHVEQTRDHPESALSMNRSLYSVIRRRFISVFVCVMLIVVSSSRILLHMFEDSSHIHYSYSQNDEKVCQEYAFTQEKSQTKYEYPGESMDCDSCVYPTMSQVLQHIGRNTTLNKWVANIGARDGVSHNDEVFELFDTHAYTGLAVEADKSFAHSLEHNLPAQVQKRMEFATPDSINWMLQESAAPLDLDAFKLDIDSYDCDVIQTVLSAGFRPKHIFMEVNPWIPPPFSWAMKFVSRGSAFNPFNVGKSDVLVGCSLQYASGVVTKYGYTLIAMRGYHDDQSSGVDAMFVRDDYAALFGDIPHSPTQVYRNWFKLACRRYFDAHKHDNRFFFMQDATYLLNLNAREHGHLGVETMFTRAAHHINENGLSQRPMTFDCEYENTHVSSRQMNNTK